MLRLLAAVLLPALLAGAEDRLVRQGFDHFYNLEYPQALAAFEQALRSEPESPELHNHVAMAIVFQEMLRGGALESELVTGNNPFLRRPKLNADAATEKRFFDTVTSAIVLADGRLLRNPKDTKALYAKGIALGLRGNWNFLVRKAWRDALKDATAGRKLHNQVTALDPSDMDARLTQGLHDYIVGSLPFTYRVLGFLAGIRGDREKGIRTIQDVARAGNRNRVDAEVFLCALYRREGKPRNALPLLDDLLRRFPRNYLLRFEQSQMYSQIGDKKGALAAIQTVAELKKRGTPGYAAIQWEKIWYQFGNLEFWYRDYEKALEYLGKVTSSKNELELNIGSLAWLRTGQSHDMLKDRTQAIEAYGKAVAFAPQADAAREARRYLSSPYRRAMR